MKKKNLYWLVESAIMIALSAVLEFVSKSIIPEMAFGGQITIVSMLPIVLVGWKYGLGKGIVTGFVYSLAELIIGIADGTITAAFLPPEQDGLGIGRAILIREGEIIGDKTAEALENEGKTLMSYIKETYHYRPDRVGKALSDIMGEEV